jgi:hypothetical protein
MTIAILEGHRVYRGAKSDGEFQRLVCQQIYL